MTLQEAYQALITIRMEHWQRAYLYRIDGHEVLAREEQERYDELVKIGAAILKADMETESCRKQ